MGENPSPLVQCYGHGVPRQPVTPELLEERAQLLRRAIDAQHAHTTAKAAASDASAARVQALGAAHRSGVTITELAAALGVSMESISKALGRPNRKV